MIIYGLAALFGVAAILFSQATVWGSILLLIVMLLAIELFVEIIGLAGANYRPLLKSCTNDWKITIQNWKRLSPLHLEEGGITFFYVKLSLCAFSWSRVAEFSVRVVQFPVAEFPSGVSFSLRGRVCLKRRQIKKDYPTCGQSFIVLINHYNYYLHSQTRLFRRCRCCHLLSSMT